MEMLLTEATTAFAWDRAGTIPMPLDRKTKSVIGASGIV
eukprot:CAMPEP_0194278306 /NCGR_PEP_ID=MMETSP0169-20130528/10383_1 /TAXON_ID=218684 /ORGANISM="Corethron pennatum, Strain L29A3" /LENGTH=38 /DNA_ID= /DNA_START= /DNA_END= /DNA_ORIENTATION=